ncbi:MAG: transporter substrate-binding domain-containing protein [Bermanella sp.]
MHSIYKPAYLPKLPRLRAGLLIMLVAMLTSQPAFPIDQANSQTIRFAVVGYPPYTIINDKQASGIDLDIVHKLAHTIKHNVVLVKCPWKRCLKLAELGKLDMLSTAMYTQKRSEYMAYIQPEYMQTSIVFFSKKTRNISIEKYEDLFSLTVGRELGSTTFEPLQSDNRITFKDYMKKKQLFDLLLSERIDILVGGKIALDYQAKKYGFAKKVTLQPYLYRGANVYFAVSKKSLLIEYLIPLNHAMKKLKKEGVLEVLFNQVSTGNKFKNYLLQNPLDHHE